MTEGTKPMLSIQEQIFDLMISDLEKRDEFSPGIISALKALIDNNELSRDRKLSEVLKMVQGGRNETH